MCGVGRGLGEGLRRLTYAAASCPEMEQSDPHYQMERDGPAKPEPLPKANVYAFHIGGFLPLALGTPPNLGPVSTEHAALQKQRCDTLRSSRLTLMATVRWCAANSPTESELQETMDLSSPECVWEPQPIAAANVQKENCTVLVTD